MPQADMLFAKFLEIKDLCETAPDQKMLKVLTDDFNRLYKRCDEYVQGEYHFLVDGFMNA